MRSVRGDRQDIHSRAIKAISAAGSSQLIWLPMSELNSRVIPVAPPNNDPPPPPPDGGAPPRPAASPRRAALPPSRAALPPPPAGLSLPVIRPRPL